MALMALVSMSLCAQVQAEGEDVPTRILFVFDASNSMNAFGVEAEN